MRLRPWLPLLSVLTQVALAFLVAFWIDGSDLSRPTSAFGYAFGVVMVTAVFLSAPLLLLLGCALVGSFARTPSSARAASIVGAVVAALVGAAGLLLAVSELAGADVGADRIFATTLLATSAIPLLPLLVAFRRVEGGS